MCRSFNMKMAGGLAMTLLLAGCAKTNTPAVRTAEVACGSCLLGLEGDGCDLAVRIDGGAYFVDGASIDDFGDAHAANGMCNVIRTGDVVGRVEGDRFVAESIVLRP